MVVPTSSGFFVTVLALGLLTAIAGCDGGTPLDPVVEPDTTPVEWASISVGSGVGFFGHTCGITTDGDAFCWGNNSMSQLGSETEGKVERPIRVAGGISFTGITLGWKHTCGLSMTGSAHCWGERTKLGTVDSEPCDVGVGLPRCDPRIATPTRVEADLVFDTISAGVGGTCGLTRDGSAYCWGTNGPLMGDGSGASSKTPVAVAGGQRFKTISVGSGSACAVDLQGQAHCWGSLGSDRHASATYAPEPVPGSVGWKTISVGHQFAKWICGLAVDGTAHCGPVGSFHSTGPQAVEGAPPLTSIESGGDFACGLTEDGAAYCWGVNNRGQLGNGTRLASGPGPVSGSLAFESLSVGASTACAITYDRKAFCWGDNGRGQAGTGKPTEIVVSPHEVAPPHR